MLLQHVFTVDRIAVDLESEDKEEVFEELVEVWARASKTPVNRKAILDAVNEREAKMSTGIKQGIAIPHGKTDAIDSLTGVIGVSRSGVDYDALDGQPVHLLFMLLSSSKDSELHLRALKRLARMLDNPEFTDELMTAESPEIAHRILRKFEDMISQD